VKVVAEGRKLDPEVVRKLADGRIYTAADAQTGGLIDAIGYEEDAINKAKAMAHIGAAHVVEYARVRTLREMLLLAGRKPDITVRLDGGLPLHEQPRLMYLWRPVPAAP
jgi:protease-4